MKISAGLLALANENVKNPVFVHYVRRSCPGFHNAGHRKAIAIAKNLCSASGFLHPIQYNRDWPVSLSLVRRENGNH